MFRRLLLLSSMFLFAGCATVRPEKMSFGEAFSASAADSPPSETPKSRQAGAAKRTARPRAQESLALHAELARFAHVAREQRSLHRTGSQMPLVQQENWRQLIEEVDRFLAAPPRTVAPSDVVRTRAVVDAELELDMNAWRSVPPELGSAVVERITRLAVRMSEVKRLGVKTVQVETTFDWPIEPVMVTSLFGRRLHPITGVVRSHFGVDLGAAMGQLVESAGAGTVIRAGWNGAHGRQVEVRHPGGVVTRYSHLSEVLVEPGVVVEKGQPLGLAGSTGLSTGVHLHFEFWRNGVPLDPLEELSEQPARPAVAVTPRS